MPIELLLRTPFDEDDARGDRALALKMADVVAFDAVRKLAQIEPLLHVDELLDGVRGPRRQLAQVVIGRLVHHRDETGRLSPAGRAKIRPPGERARHERRLLPKDLFIVAGP